ncbi:hypothetical protein A4X13_0g2118 [Tilletia indica]|uniref:Uncharacterized protein n=1 Tax=Tilletia indica TaxID=43049 RepID=A0A177TGH7_9BASI|nr:hypothetical protein A4X13_0g2118 [Tilletia indica]
MQAHDAGVLSLSLLIVLLPLSITTGALACRITILHRSAPAAIFLIFNAFFTTALLITALALAVLSVGRKQAHALTIKIISLAILFALWLAACVFAQLKLQLSAADSQAEARLIRATRATAWTSFALVTLALGAALLSTRLTNSTESTRTDVEAKGSLNGSTSTTTQPTEKETHEETVDSGRNYTPSQSSASVSSSILGIFNPTRRRQHNGASEGRAEEQDGELQEEEGEDWEIVDMDDVAVPPASGAELTQQSNGARVVGRRGFKGKLGGRKPSPLPPPGTALPALPPTTTTQPQQQLPNSGSASTFVGSAVALTVPKTVGGTSSSSASYSHTELGLDGDSGSPNISIGQQSSSIHTGNGNGNGGGRARGMSILRLPQSLKALAHPHPHQNSESRPSTANESESGVGVGARKIEPNPHLQPQEFGAGSGAPESPNMVAY